MKQTAQLTNDAQASAYRVMAAKAVRPQYLRLCAGDLISTATASAADASNAGLGYMAVMVLRIRNKQEQQPFVGTPCAWSSLTSQVTQQRDLLQLITNVVGNDSVSASAAHVLT